MRWFQTAERWPLWGTAIISLAGYWLVRYWFPLRPYYDQLPQADIRFFTPTLFSGLAYAAWLCLLFGLVWLAYRRVLAETRPISLRMLMGTAFLLAFPLLLTYPINATDVYRYIVRGRINSIYGQNPFAVPPNGVEGDAFLPFAGEWAGATSPYGPIWETAAGAITAISQDNLYWGIILFKAVGLSVHLGITILIWQSLADKSPPVQAARSLLWAWNPALLLMFVVDAHNDVFMLFWLVWGWYLAKNGRITAGFVVMLLAPLTKPIGLLALPIFFLHFWREMATARLRLQFLLLSGLGGVTAVTLAFLPFSSPLSLISRLQSEAIGGAGFSFGALLLLLAGQLDINITIDLLNGLGLLLATMFGLWIIWLSWRVWLGRSPIRSLANGFAGSYLQALNYRIWYSTWLLPWLLLADGGEKPTGYRLRAGMWFLLTSQLSVIVYGHLRVYALGGSQLLAHAIGVPFTFGLPLLLARQRYDD